MSPGNSPEFCDGVGTPTHQYVRPFIILFVLYFPLLDTFPNVLPLEIVHICRQQGSGFLSHSDFFCIFGKSLLFFFRQFRFF